MPAFTRPYTNNDAAGELKIPVFPGWGQPGVLKATRQRGIVRQQNQQLRYEPQSSSNLLLINELQDDMFGPDKRHRQPSSLLSNRL